MALKDNDKIHRIISGGEQPVAAPRHSTLALRKSRLVRRRVRRGFYTIGFTLSLAAIAQAGYGFLMDTPYLKVKSASVEGVKGPLALEIQGLVSSLLEEKQNILEIDTKELTDKIGRHPRIRDLSVQKIYPDKLVIHAVERHEVAILQTGSGFYLADSEGNAMEELKGEELARLALPYISGLNSDLVNEGEPVKSESMKKAINLLEVLDERNADLYAKISDVEIQRDEASPIETLTMHLIGGLDVRFGDGNPVDRLPHLEALLKSLEDRGVDPYNDLAYIDLRFKNMGAYMDRATATDVDRHQYDKVQQELEEAELEYQKAHLAKRGKGVDSGDDDDEDAPAPRKTATKRQGVQRQPPPPPGTYGVNSGNYRQYPQQNVPQQYYQQRQYNPAAQNAPMYNLPANQPRY